MPSSGTIRLSIARKLSTRFTRDGMSGMRPLARTPGIRLMVIRKEVRTLAADPEVRVVAVPCQRRILVPDVEQRTFAVSAKIRSLAA